NTKGGLKIPEESKDNIQYISPEGPLSNNVFALTLHNKDFWVAFGGYGTGMNPYVPNGLTLYGLSYMKNMQNWEQISPQDLNQFKSTVNISFNPQVPNTAYISSFHDGLGLLDLNSGNFTVYNHQNTDVLNAISSDDIRINGVAVDRNGTGWMTNSGATPFLVSIDKNNQSNSYVADVFESISAVYVFLRALIDINITKWIGSDFNGLFAVNDTQHNKSMLITTLHNLPSRTIIALAIHYYNQLWIGTAPGHRIISI